LVRDAFSGPLDIVGDVHGELDALEQLLAVLGYRGRGEHRGGRRLVFIGDLCDRGPDSPGVVRRVRELVEAGTAQCLLGNHEVSLLRGTRKEANGWFFDRDHDREAGRFEASRPVADAAGRESIRSFLGTLPLVLEREDLRLVHACWNDARVAEARAAGTASAVELHRDYAARSESRTRDSGLAAEAESQLRQFGERLRDRQAQVPMLGAMAARGLDYQLSNPVRVLTSGTEQLAREPFFLAGKWRMVERAAWWDDYGSNIPVVFGHYWRWPTPRAGARYGKRAEDPFGGRGSNEWLGPANSAFCVDFSVGARYAERLHWPGDSFASRLGAVRWPERELLFEDGSGADLAQLANLTPPRSVR
jgi:hypothetical protein